MPLQPQSKEIGDPTQIGDRFGEAVNLIRFDAVDG
jgi:hypothetical protein